jgi:hypothetical protein
VGFWPLTDGTGTTAKDISTGANDGTASGTVNWLSGDIGMAADFASVTGYFDTGAGTSTLGISGGSTASISAWVNYTTGGSITQNVFGDLGSGGVAPNFGMYIGPWPSFVDVWRNEANARFTSVTFSGWMHFVAVYDTSNIYLYINGSLHGTIASSGSINASTGNCMIGNQPANNRNLEGQEQNVRIYNRALSATEVATLYNRPWEGTNYGTLWPYSPPAPADATLSTDTAATSLNVDLEGWWLCTDNTGTTLVDISGNGRDATLTGTNSWVADSVGTVNRFDNSSGGGSSASTTDYQISLSTYTIALWVNHEEAGLASGNKYGGGLSLTNGNSASLQSDVEFYFNPSSTSGGQWPQVVHNRSNGGTIGLWSRAESAKTSENGVWRFYVLTYDGTNARFYKDAVLAGTSSSLAAPISTTGKHLNIATNRDPDGITCSMQNIRLYSRALSADEITILYERPWEGIEYGDAFHYDPPTPANLTPLTSDSINNSQIGWWPLTETDDYASGAADISGNGNNGTQSGGVLSEVSRLGGVASFDGVNDIIDASAYTIASTSSMTMAGWIRYTSTVGSVCVLNICNAGGGTTAQYTRNIAINSSGNASCNVQSGTAIAQAVGSTVFDIGEWYFVVGTFDKVGTSYDVEIFVNGVSEATASGTGSELTPYTNTCIGGARRYNNAITAVEPCEIHNVRLWDRALTADEVWDIYANPWLGSAYTATPSAVLYNYILRSKRFRRLS